MDVIMENFYINNYNVEAADVEWSVIKNVEGYANAA